MCEPERKTGLGVFEPIVSPWYESLKDPVKAQKETFLKLRQLYQKTDFGRSHGAFETEDIEGFRTRFPVLDYRRLQSILGEVKRGNHQAILPEPPACWVMTRGSTGPAKVFPVTKTHLEQIFFCGARALVNYVSRTKDFELLAGRILNLNFPSSVHTMVMDERTVSYGYSSGTYAKLNPALSEVSLLPRQEEVDALGAGITRQDWRRRFELAYERALNAKVVAAMGVTPVILSFAKYVDKKYGKKPKELWDLRALFCTSVRNIQFKYAPLLRKYFGQIPVVEIYSATEGVFAQQLDDLPYVAPNYDTYLFEVETGKGVKMLHELKRGEWGSLIVSSCILPRYKIGDMIESAGKNYFRVFGRDRKSTVLTHRLYRLFFGRFT